MITPIPSDAFENITHSVCTLEFADHRPLYDWVLMRYPLEAYPRKVEGRPQQIEFARLNLSYTVMSKRKLRNWWKGYVEGWDDPAHADYFRVTAAAIRRKLYAISANASV